MNKKARRAALRCALSAHVADGSFIVLDSLKFDAPKTKDMIKVLGALNVTDKALIVLAGPDANVVKSVNNIPTAKTLYVNTLNVYDLVKFDKLIMTADAVNKVEEVYL